MREIAVIGDPISVELWSVLGIFHGAFRPNDVIAASAPGDARAAQVVPLLAGKTSSGPVTTYICRDFTCQAPVVGVDAARAAL